MQKKLSESKSRSFLSSFEESTKILANVEQLRKQQAEILAKGQEANNRLKQLITIVGSPPGKHQIPRFCNQSEYFDKI